MPYSELIKNFNGIRDYMREFYVYGFKSRGQFTKKSARSYDDERRRIESWLGDYMSFRQTVGGKTLFLSIDSRVSPHNPLYKAWKAKSFTSGDITLHFLIFDILHSPEAALSLGEITDEIDNRLCLFENPKTFDASTLRKKLKEYADYGVIHIEKAGKTARYRRAEQAAPDCADALSFFSETAPCGVIGSFLLDKAGSCGDYFAFKHHYITGALDSDILLSLLEAMHQKQFVQITALNRRSAAAAMCEIAPLRIYLSVQSGRQYLMAYNPKNKRISSFRLDNILSVQPGVRCEQYDTYIQSFENMRRHIWGVSTASRNRGLERVEFTVRYADNEQHIHNRLSRERRCGQVEKIDYNTSRFTADVYDSKELVPWIRTFICRITDIHFSNSEVEAAFKKDLERMYGMYGLIGGDET